MSPIALLAALAASTEEPACTGAVLRYFNIRGRGEAIRMALADSSLAFKDESFTSEQWGKDTPDGLKAEWVAAGKLPFGQVPLLEIDGLNLVQSHTILRYLGRKQGWYSSNFMTAEQLARIDLVADGTEDVRKLLSAIKYSDDTDAEKARRLGLYFSSAELGARWLGYLEALIGREPEHACPRRACPHAAGTRVPTHADYLLLDLLDYHESFDAPATAALLQTMPRLVAWRAEMLNRPALKKYLDGPGRRAN